ncbi:lipoyl(octanoyl) transferase LipB [Anaplasma platys]|uniref:Octanoyltransferase n=1 Tax=Anaplasma platys TaxID=949 RepID=A0A858PXM0_9RICK|nr:lipoyl(octanoyl) transferase LipB [Anaplasma platys]QJC27324.1 lipoyl(octanoyl) transferase LipB [Anaplasma platys]
MCVEWKTSCGLVEYSEACTTMIERVDGIIRGDQEELVWLLEHQPVYTAGTSAKPEELLDDNLFPVLNTTRGGKYSYHGPGQRVVYVMLDLKRRDQCNIREYVRNLGNWIVNTLVALGVDSYFDKTNIGVWVKNGAHSEKIAAMGIRLRKWVTYHGVSINVSTDLSHYAGIIPCGLAGLGVTSLRKLGKDVSMEVLDEVLRREFAKVF